MADDKSRRVLVGRVTGAHGVRGLVRVESYMQEPEAIVRYGPVEDEAGRPLRLSLKGRSKALLLAAVEGISDREPAAALAGTALYIQRAALPEPAAEEYYEADLIGLAVVTRVGRHLGRIKGCAAFGAGPLLEVTPADGGETVFVPFTAAVVPEVRPAQGHVVVDLPRGLWPGADEED